MSGMKPIRAVIDAAQEFKPMVDQPEPPRPLYRDIPPPDPYPIDALGDVLGGAAREIMTRVQAPDALCGQSVLAAAALAVQGHADIEMPDGRTHPLSLFMVSIAESGDRKTAVDYQALWPVRKHEANLRRAYEGELAAYDDDKAAFATVKERVKKDGKKLDRAAMAAALQDVGTEPLPPLLPMLTFDDPNWPALAKAFHTGHPSLGLFSSEGGSFLGGYGMNADNRLNMAANLSKAWGGEPIQRTRVTGDGIIIMPGRRLSMHLMLQPGVANRLFGDAELQKQGILARTLTSAPASLAGTRLLSGMPAPPDAAIRRYGARLLSILEADPPLVRDTRNELEPRPLPLSAEARQLWLEFYNSIERQEAPDGPLAGIRAFASKAAEQAARMAGVLALVDNIEASEVSGDAMAGGVTLANYYLSEALRLQDGAAVPPDLQAAQRLWEWLQEWPEPLISLPNIYQRGPRSIRNKRTAARMVDLLADHGYLAPAGGNVVNGEKRRETWRIWGR